MSARRLSAFAAAALVGWLGSGPAWAVCKPLRPVRFAAGADAAELTGGIPRGDSDCYTIGARGGQTLTITQLHPVDDNIVFQLYQPHWKVAQTGNEVNVTGHPLPGAGEGQDAREWSGRLPVSGEYLLVLGTSRGGGEYRVRVQIR